MKVAISERFYTIQGEGPTSGMPCLFIRFSDCNLHCNGAWLCDSQGVMSKTYTMDLEREILQTATPMWANCERIIFTGGEPMLYQEEILEIIEFVRTTNKSMQYEIETNGTIMPNESLLRMANMQFNCSPKLSNSGQIEARRIKPKVIDALARQTYKSVFKFVVNSPEDLEEIRRDFRVLWVNYKYKLWFMPAGANQEQLAITAPLVAQLCIEEGVNFSNRNHIVLWNDKKGV